MSNSFGRLFKFTTWGESHGEAIGCVVDGVPSLIPLSEADIQPYLDARKPGQSKFTTQRQESDTVKILSGVFEGMTTGTPISLIIYNEDQRSKDYGDIKDKFRPAHADYTYWLKYGIRDYRGGGRSSARETAMRVAAGAIARKIIAAAGMSVRGCLVQVGDKVIDRSRFDWMEVGNNPFFCPDVVAAKAWEEYLMAIRKEGSSVGAVIEVVAEGVPAGLGAPIYGKLDTDIAAAMMSINAVKGVEIGDGFATAALRGEENADEMKVLHERSAVSGSGCVERRATENMSGASGEKWDGKVEFSNNHAGGILGGISSGQPVVARFVVKPTSSILKEVNTVDIHGNNTTLITKGRHDPCVGIRAVPVGEAMLACVLADHLMLHRAQQG